MIVFENIKWKNFLSTGQQGIEVELNKDNTTLIVGHNGAGKSTILDALCFGLFNKPFREIKKDQLINSINLGGTEISIEFSIAQNKYKVIRGIKPNIFQIYLNGEMINQEATIADQQKHLENNILKFNYRSFTQVVILGSSTFVPFMELKAPHRREVVEDILDIKVFSVMNMLVKMQIKEVTEQLRDIDRDIEITKSKIETQKQYLEETGKQNTKVIVDYQNKIKENSQAIDKYTTHIDAINKKIGDIKSTILDEEKTREQVKKLNSFETQFESKVKQCTKHKKFYEAYDNCPTCKQSINPQFKTEKIADENKEIIKFNQALEDVAKEIKSKQRRLQAIASVHEEIKVLEIDSAKFEQSKNELNNINTKLAHNIEQLSTVSEDTGKAKGKLEELEMSFYDLEDKELKKKEEIDYLQAARVMLADTGIKTKVIKQYLPIMNQLINKYLASMDFFVNFKLDDEFKEIIRSRFRDDFSYTSFSEGEKMRINLALLFTWRAIAKMKNSISTNLLLLDEIFDSSLDGQGTDDFLKILNTLEGENVFIISHKTDIMADKFKQQIRFEKEKNFTRIVE
tara:strand:- start:8463 stop:10175 length:1713 start_codon:yes stop_codon:yes gene_type:complete